jgi:hypothetical protein
MNEDLLFELTKFEKDPYAFVMWAFPWGEAGTELEHRKGPEPWQREELLEIGRRLQRGVFVIQDAVASGHGIGKSALVSWIILWAVTTFPNTKGVVTANTERQLRTKTWAELAKWFGLFIAKDLFSLDATCIKVRSTETEENAKWRVDMVPWSDKNTEAFAGLHNLGRRILLLMDEASAIADLVWEVSEGALTDQHTQIIWLAFGNPTKSSGRFRDCFEGGKFAHRWRHKHIDSRSVSFTNKDLFQTWVEDWGEDSDFVRVRVRGEFPRIDSESFISWLDATEAVDRDIDLPHPYEPVILGVDIGRFGDDPSVIVPRQGRDASSREWEVYFGLDTMQIAARIAAAYLRHDAQVVMIDSGGVGGGVVDRLRMLNVPTLEVEFGSNPTIMTDGVKYANKRAEIWGHMRSWLKVGSIPGHVRGVEMTVVDELCAPRFFLTRNTEAIQLESKRDMRSRGVKSPNLADALACTFAFPVVVPKAVDVEAERRAYNPDYNPYDAEHMNAF